MAPSPTTSISNKMTVVFTSDIANPGCTDTATMGRWAAFYSVVDMTESATPSPDVSTELSSTSTENPTTIDKVTVPTTTPSAPLENFLCTASRECQTVCIVNSHIVVGKVFFWVKYR